MRLVIRILAPIALLVAFLAPAATASADPAESERHQSYNSGINTCNGEYVEVKGSFHIVTKLQKDGTYLHRYVYQGTGLGDQGNRYVMNTTNRLTASSSEFSQDIRVLMVSQGSAPNQVIIVHFNPDGSTSTTTDCRG